MAKSTARISLFRSTNGLLGKAAQALITTGQSPAPVDLKPVDLAAWTMVARAVLNLNETITRN